VPSFFIEDPSFADRAPRPAPPPEKHRSIATGSKETTLRTQSKTFDNICEISKNPFLRKLDRAAYIKINKIINFHLFIPSDRSKKQIFQALYP
jgi:hypothetical protein